MQVVKARPSRITHLSNAILMRCLLRGPVSVAGIVHATGLCGAVVRRYLRALHERRVIHVAAWAEDADGKRSIREYSLGDYPDRVKPPRRTRAELSERERQRRAALREAA